MFGLEGCFFFNFEVWVFSPLKKVFQQCSLNSSMSQKKCFVFFYFISMQNIEIQPSVWNATHNSEILLFCGYFLNRFYLPRIIVGTELWNIMKEENICDSYYIRWGSQKRLSGEYQERGLNKWGDRDRLWMILVMSLRGSNLIGNFGQKVNKIIPLLHEMLTLN